MGPWHRTFVGTAAGVMTGSFAVENGNGSAPWIMGVAAAVLILTVAHGWGWPRWQQWRAGRKEDGYLKIIGGYRTANRLVIRYKGGRQDAMVMPPVATGVGVAHSPTVTTGPDGSWMRVRKWLANKVGPL
jgi:hypothetical protein